MDQTNVTAAAILLGLVLFVVVYNTCTYRVHEREQAVITRLSRPVGVVVGGVADDEFEAIRRRIVQTAMRSDELGATPGTGQSVWVKRGAGLYLKVPFVDSVHYLPDTLLVADAEPSPLLLKDKKTLTVDSFARWRIENPLRFYVSVNTVRRARDRLDDIIYSAILQELGKSTLTEVIRTSNKYVDRAAPSQEGLDVDLVEDESLDLAANNPMQEIIEKGREDVMSAVTRSANETARELGIQIVDVRIKRADLLQENLQAVFGRMAAERARISRAYRSEGRKEADIIEGRTDREVRVILADAQREAKILRGEGDAEALRILAEAFNANPDLYRFIRSLEVIKEATQPGSEILLGLESSLFRLLRDAEGISR